MASSWFTPLHPDLSVAPAESDNSHWAQFYRLLDMLHPCGVAAAPLMKQVKDGSWGRWILFFLHARAPSVFPHKWEWSKFMATLTTHGKNHYARLMTSAIPRYVHRLATRKLTKY